jgi:hypothetical protein
VVQSRRTLGLVHACFGGRVVKIQAYLKSVRIQETQEKIDRNRSAGIAGSLKPHGRSFFVSGARVQRSQYEKEGRGDNVVVMAVHSIVREAHH